MIDPMFAAERASITNLLNCYLRETGDGEWIGYHPMFKQMPILRLLLPSLNLAILAPVRYRSETGRHRFDLPIYMLNPVHEIRPISLATVASLLLEQLSVDQSSPYPRELLRRILNSNNRMATYLQARMGDLDSLYEPDLSFLDYEQSLLYGHPFHPTPKSCEGVQAYFHPCYSPETRGRFQLRYFAAHRSIVQERSEWGQPASALIRTELYRELASPDLDHRSSLQSHMKAYLDHPSYVLIPVHPVQAESILKEQHVINWQAEGKLIDLGRLGQEYSATSSIRTVCREASAVMYKCSLQVKITNSVRINKRAELDGALEACRVLDQIKAPLHQVYPHFHFIRDGAYMTLSESAEGESGFELLIREHPFQGADGKRVIVAAAFTQDGIQDEEPLMVRMIRKSRGANKREKRTSAGVSRAWFRAYMKLTLHPMVWLYNEYGIALEAHLQNSLIVLDEDGFPQDFYYRDSQGYYYARSMVERLEKLVPGTSKSSNVFDDAIVDERFGYYLIVNHMLGMIQSFGAAGLVDEKVLLFDLYEALESLQPLDRIHSSLIQTWLHQPTMRVKANLLTQCLDIDELESELEQAVYAHMPNPLYPIGAKACLIRKAKHITSHWREQVAAIG
ncbi:IucA/IucC family protein [Paenibacillus sp. 1001270B_150601_E10]|uniref:IucA/IucC family protein n=1 Tax=Paenibacillus sp. 1001270B_150601_E10 TaxID=2787079 RepID=UPI00189FFB96|nr:IucA/IucC family protein [Paenibacillus sp. 1001270B_150601_E10]